MMIFRFSLYGFLKNLRFFEPFLILYFLSLGLSYFQIGILFSYNAIVVNILEIPSGTFADLFGKKRSMIFSFVFYIISFLIFSFSSSFLSFFPAFTLFALGEAFRTGTHKAIIFEYLQKQGLQDQKTRVYGYTRSWSKIGSAVSAVVAAIIMFFVRDYHIIFIASILPYAVNIVNFMGYPADPGRPASSKGMGVFFRELAGAFRRCFTFAPLRNLILSTMSYEGVFEIAKSYLQPVIQAFALSLPVLLLLDNHRRTVVLIGLVYACIFLLSSYASRNSYKFVKRTGNHRKTLSNIIILTLLAHLVIALCLWLEFQVIPVLLFLALYFLQNAWRPVVVAQVNEYSPQEKSTAILSIESQSKTFFVFLFAPFFGLLIDLMGLYFLGVLASFFLILSYIFFRGARGSLR